MPPALQYPCQRLPLPPPLHQPWLCLSPSSPHALIALLAESFSSPFGLLDFAFQADAFTFLRACLFPSHSPATWSKARSLETAWDARHLAVASGVAFGMVSPQPPCSQAGEMWTAEMLGG